MYNVYSVVTMDFLYNNNGETEIYRDLLVSTSKEDAFTLVGHYKNIELRDYFKFEKSLEDGDEIYLKIDSSHDAVCYRSGVHDTDHIKTFGLERDPVRCYTYLTIKKS